MDHCIVEDVADSSTNFRRREQLARKVVVREHRSRATRSTVDRARDADHDTAHASRQRCSVQGFDYEVDVIALYREVDNAQSEPRSAGFQRAFNRGEECFGSQ